MANRYTGKRKGCIYPEVTNAGHRYAKGVGCVDRFFKARFVAVYCYYGKRYRFRSTSYATAVCGLRICGRNTTTSEILQNSGAKGDERPQNDNL